MPDLFYDATTGILTLDTDGQPIKTLKVTTPDPFTIAGASLLDGSTSYGEANGLNNIWPTTNTSTGFPEGYFGSDDVFRQWISTYFDVNGTSQWSLQADSSNAGMTGVFDIAQFPPGLDLTAFGTPANTTTPQGAELGEFTTGPAATFFTEVALAPMPGFDEGIADLSATPMSVDDWFGTNASTPEVMSLNDEEQYPGGVTMFVPTDAALQAAGLSAADSRIGAERLTVHISPDPNDADLDNDGLSEAELMSLVPSAGDMVTLTTIDGTPMTLMNGSLIFGGAEVVVADALQASNGWIHVLDAVPVPEPDGSVLMALACLAENAAAQTLIRPKSSRNLFKEADFRSALPFLKSASQSLLNSRLDKYPTCTFSRLRQNTGSFDNLFFSHLFSGADLEFSCT